MKNIIRLIFILIILGIIIIILSFDKSRKNFFEDITILSFWKDIGAKSEYEISTQDIVEIDVFTTLKSKGYKKIAPGCKGSFVIKITRQPNTNLKIKINEKTLKPKNLVFSIENKKFTSLEEMEKIINRKFMNKEKLTIDWEWEYYINDVNDIQDTKDGENIEKYIFEIEAIVEEKERTEI